MRRLRLMADDVYFIHNHPSGNLRPSMPDEQIRRRLELMLGDKLKGCLIMNLRSGKYCIFGEGDFKTMQRPGEGGEEPIAVKRFDRQVFSPGYDLEGLTKVTSSDVVASFVASQRLGGRSKISFLILDRANHIVGNIHTPYGSYTENASDLSEMMIENAVRFGGMAVIPYGNVGLEGLKAVNEMMRNSGTSVKMLDAVNVMNGLSYESAFDRGVMESGAPYSAAVDNGWRQRMIDERGVVMPGLTGKSVNVVGLEKHPFNTAQRTVDLKKEVKDYAVDANIIGVMANGETGGKGRISISRSSIDKFIDDSAANKGVGKDVHLSVLPRLRDVIRESILVESHTDYNKVDGVRNVDS